MNETCQKMVEISIPSELGYEKTVTTPGRNELHMVFYR
jgi:hypothetical protein